MSNNTIIIPAKLVQAFVDEPFNTEIVSFNWRPHRTPEIDLGIQQDMEIKVDDIGEFLELQDELAITKQELAEVGVDYEQLELGYAGLEQLHALYVSHMGQEIAQLQQQIEELHQAAAQKEKTDPRVNFFKKLGF